MKLYIKKSNVIGAWLWIDKGYSKAWQEVGFDVEHVNNLSEINSSEYDISIREWDIETLEDLSVLEKARRAYVFAQPQTFPLPWGRHPNFISTLSNNVIERLNQMENVFLWTFGNVNPKFHHKWKKVNTVPLAFDSISYKPLENTMSTKYDICFIGGWANNGFNEKRKIIIKNFFEFKNSGLKCGFFINKNLSHEQENNILCNSMLSLNLHDNYQRVLGYDTNERTFKSLGLNGLLISDQVEQLTSMFPNVKTSNEPTELVKFAKDFLMLTKKEINNIKEENKQKILEKHCYINRVQQLMELTN